MELLKITNRIHQKQSKHHFSGNQTIAVFHSLIELEWFILSWVSVGPGVCPQFIVKSTTMEIPHQPLPKFSMKLH